MKILLLFALSIFCFADLYKVGDKITFTNVKNQFDKKYEISKDIKKIIISSSKDVGEKLKEYMLENAKYQEQTQSLLYANVFKVVDNMFLSILFNNVIIKEIRSRDYSLGLIKEKTISEKIPIKDEHFTIFHLDKNIIKQIDFTKSIK